MPKNDGVDNVSSFQPWLFWGIYVKLRGGGNDLKTHWLSTMRHSGAAQESPNQTGHNPKDCELAGAGMLFFFGCKVFDLFESENEKLL